MQRKLIPTLALTSIFALTTLACDKGKDDKKADDKKADDKKADGDAKKEGEGEGGW